jgi:hypothetical protein
MARLLCKSDFEETHTQIADVGNSISRILVCRPISICTIHNTRNTEACPIHNTRLLPVSL